MRIEAAAERAAKTTRAAQTDPAHALFSQTLEKAAAAAKSRLEEEEGRNLAAKSSDAEEGFWSQRERRRKQRRQMEEDLSQKRALAKAVAQRRANLRRARTDGEAPAIVGVSAAELLAGLC